SRAGHSATTGVHQLEDRAKVDHLNRVGMLDDPVHPTEEIGDGRLSTRIKDPDRPDLRARHDPAWTAPHIARADDSGHMRTMPVRVAVTGDIAAKAVNAADDVERRLLGAHAGVQNSYVDVRGAG